MKNKKSITRIILYSLYIILAFFVKAIGWIVRKATLGLVYHLTVRFRDVFFQQVNKYHVKINNTALDDMDAHKIALGKKEIQSLKKQYGKENVQILKQETHFEPQPFYVWMIAFFCLGVIIAGMMGWNAGTNLGEF